MHAFDKFSNGPRRLMDRFRTSSGRGGVPEGKPMVTIDVFLLIGVIAAVVAFGIVGSVPLGIGADGSPTADLNESKYSNGTGGEDCVAAGGPCPLPVTR